MTRDLSALAETFAWHFGGRPDRARVIAGLAAVFASEEQRLAGPATEDEIRKRRLDVIAGRVFASYQDRTGVTRDQLCSTDVDHAGDRFTVHREAVAWLLRQETWLRRGREERLSWAAAGQILHRTAAWALGAAGRHEARAAAVIASAVTQLRSAAR